jgi:hypothetical protein
LLVALAIVLLAAPAASAQRSARVVPAAGPVVIDGRLDEAAWDAAPSFDAFVERKPSLRGEPPVRTSFRVLTDGSSLIFGVRSDDPEPGGVTARVLARDTFDIFNDDAIGIKLDPTLDRRTTIGFALNAAGGRMDYRGLDEQRWQLEFDPLWEGAVTVDAGGFSAELRIPLTSLGLDPDSPPERIGLNLSRDHSRRNATYDWALMAPPYSPIAASLYGELTGVAEAVREARGSAPAADESPVAVVPYMLTGFRRSSGEGAPDTEPVLDTGFDVAARLGAGFTGLLTVHTDFAQVDLDDRVVNLTRFDLFLPEKRDFFLRDADLFAFGLPGEAQLFHSRRIGLHQGMEVPVAGGAKVTGKSDGGLRVGALDVITQPDEGQPWLASGVLRAQQVFDGGSYVGAMLTHRQSLEGDAATNLGVGLDASWRGSKTPWLVEGFSVLTVDAPDGFGDGSLTDGAASGLVSYRGELVRPSLRWSFIGEELRPLLGFFRRTGIHQGTAGLIVEPRIGAGGLEKITFDLSGGAVLGEDGGLLDWSGVTTTTLTWDAGWTLGATVSRTSDTVAEPFTVGRGTTIEPGDYDSWRYGVLAGTPTTLPVSGTLTVTHGDWFGGALTSVAAGLSARPVALVRLEVATGADLARFEDAARDFDSLVVNSRVAFGFLPELGLDVTSGWSALADQVVLQSRLRWTWSLGSDLFVVYQANVRDDDGRLPFQSLLVKLTSRWP